MKRIIASAAIAAALSSPAYAEPYVKVADLCSFWCAEPETPIVSAKAKINNPIDRGQFRYELDYFPELIRKMAWMVNGEVGRNAPIPIKIVQLETAFNRAQARGQSLTQILLSVKEDAADGYYAVDTYCRHAEPTQDEVETFKKAVLDQVMHGSNLSDVGYGPMTGNASANVAAHQFAHGTPGYHLQDGDSYFLEGPLINPFPEISPASLTALSFGGE